MFRRLTAVAAVLVALAAPTEALAAGAPTEVVTPDTACIICWV